jgi:hypothetical protein
MMGNYDGFSSKRCVQALSQPVQRFALVCNRILWTERPVIRVSDQPVIGDITPRILQRIVKLKREKRVIGPHARA